MSNRAWIRDRKQFVIAQHNAGNALATDVIRYVQMYERCPEPGAAMFMEEAIKQFHTAFANQPPDPN